MGKLWRTVFMVLAAGCFFLAAIHTHIGDITLFYLGFAFVAVALI